MIKYFSEERLKVDWKRLTILLFVHKEVVIGTDFYLDHRHTVNWLGSEVNWFHFLLSLEYCNKFLVEIVWFSAHVFFSYLLHQWDYPNSYNLMHKNKKHKKFIQTVKCEENHWSNIILNEITQSWSFRSIWSESSTSSSRKLLWMNTRHR